MSCDSPSLRRSLYALTTLSILGALPQAALATVPDEFGAGGRQIGRGGGGVARAEGGHAASLNPAGLYRLRRPTITMAMSYGMQRFAAPGPVWWDTNRDGSLDERDPPLDLSEDGVDDTFGVHLSLGRHIGSRFGIGMSIYVPADRLFRLKTFEPALPTYMRYDNRPQRYVFTGGVGGQVLPGVSIGAAIDFVPRVAFTVGMTADIVVAADADAGDLGELVTEAVIDIHEIDLDVVPGLAPSVGLELDPGRWTPRLRGLTIGATWRGEVGVPITADLDIQANITATDIGSLDPFAIAAIIDAELFLFDHYVPMKVDLGIAYSYEPWVSFYADARWTDWRRLLMSVARVESADLTTPLFDLNEAITDGNAYTIGLRSTWDVRVGGDLNLPRFEFEKNVRYLQLTTRAGFGWAQSPLVDQGDDSAFLDANRWWLAGGLGAEIWDPTGLLDGPIRLDAFFQYHQLVPRTLTRSTDTPRAGYPVDGTGFTASGHILVLGAELGLTY